MSTRRTRLVVAGVAALGLVGLAVPAQAATSGDTTVTFTLAAGELAISAPASANLGTVGGTATVAQVTGQLGNTVVTDNRGGVASIHNVTLSSGDFTTGTGGANKTIAGSTVTAMSGAVTHTNTTATAVAVATIVAVPSGSTIMGLSAYTGNDKATYNPTVTIPIPVTNVAGTYTGTITQTVLAV